MVKILYVEDNDNNAYMLSSRLKRRGYEIFLAPDGEKGIDVAEREQPDLILMDLNMPVLDGWEATRRLKQSPQTSSIPIIALSAHAMSEDRGRAMSAGCDDFDTKPVNFSRLLEKIQALLPDALET